MARLDWDIVVVLTRVLLTIFKVMRGGSATRARHQESFLEFVLLFVFRIVRHLVLLIEHLVSIPLWGRNRKVLIHEEGSEFDPGCVKTSLRQKMRKIDSHMRHSK